MIDIRQFKSEIMSVKTQILEVALTVILMSSLPLIVSKILSYNSEVPWQTSDSYIFIVLGLVALVLTFRKRLVFHIKLNLCIIAMFLGGCLSFIDKGLTSNGIIFFTFTALLASMIENRRNAYLVGIAIIIANGVITYLYINGVLVLNQSILMSLTSDQLYVQKLLMTLIYVFVIMFSYTKLIVFLDDYVVKLMSAQIEMNQVKVHTMHELEKKIDERTVELKLTIEELAKKEKMASMTSLVSGLAHEINTPLGVIISSMSYLEQINESRLHELISGNMKKEEKEAYHLEISECTDLIMKSLGRVTELVSEFKKLSVNINAEQMVSLPIKLFLESIVKGFESEFTQKQVVFDVACEETLHFNTYPSSMTQLCNCFINNALDHAFRDNGGRLLISAGVEQDRLLLSFEDNGEGILESDQGRIFEPFFTTARNRQHVGLGLAIAYTLVTEKLGGSLCLDSENQKGCKFLISLPITNNKTREETL